MNTIKKYAIYIFTLFLFLGIQQEIFAQKNNMQDVVYLNNGGKIIGTILEKSDDLVKIRLQGGSEFVFEIQDIKEITSEPHYRPKAYFRTKDKGYYNWTTLALNVGTSNGQINGGWSLHTINGYQFHPKLSVGLGLGLDIYADNFDADLYLPLYVDVRGDLLTNTKATPIYYGGIGYGFLLTGRNDASWTEKGGLHYNYGFGFKVRGKRYSDWVFTVGQQSQFYTWTFFTPGNEWNNGSRTESQDVWYNRIVIRSGISF